MRDHSKQWYAGYSQALAEVESWRGSTEPLSRLAYHLRNLRVAPDDIIVFSCQEHLTYEQIAQIRSQLVEALKSLGVDREVLILTRGAELETADRHRKLAYAARDLITLAERCPELFEHVLPISDDDMRTLREIADGDEAEEA